MNLNEKTKITLIGAILDDIRELIKESQIPAAYYVQSFQDLWDWTDANMLGHDVWGLIDAPFDDVIEFVDGAQGWVDTYIKLGMLK